MKTMNVTWDGQAWPDCQQYEPDDEPGILDGFFYWKAAVLLADKTTSMKPGLPETFSKPFACLVSGLLYNPGRGPNAFRLRSDGATVEAAVDIKATVGTSANATFSRFLRFDEVYWLNMTDHVNLRFSIIRFTKAEIGAVLRRPKAEPDRGFVGPWRLSQDLGRSPFLSGRIGFVREKMATPALIAV